jgi:hypothetical protein
MKFQQLWSNGSRKVHPDTEQATARSLSVQDCQTAIDTETLKELMPCGQRNPQTNNWLRDSSKNSISSTKETQTV